MSMPKIGDTVHCPPDRGDPGYSGRVTNVGQTVCTNIHGTKYVWVTVQKDTSTRHVWPSHRLGFMID